MSWFKKDKEKTTKKQASSREQIVAQAKQSLQHKREEIGDETLQAIRKAIENRQNSSLQKALNNIKAQDTDKVLDNLGLWLKDK